MKTWRTAVLAAGTVLGSCLLLAAIIACYFKSRPRRFRHQRQNKVEDVSGAGFLPYGRAVKSEMMPSRRTDANRFDFDWSEHGQLVSEAIQRGWSAFALTYTCTSSCPVPNLCTKCCLGDKFQPEISWEVGPGSDFMQLIRLNPRLGEKPKKPTELEARRLYIQTMHSALPLPGPTGISNFPPEAYFEITILSRGSEYRINTGDSSEDVKLILRPSPSDKYPMRAHNVNGFLRAKTVHLNSNTNIDDDQVLGVGFSMGVSPYRLPGIDQGSFGFHSDGHIYINGIQHKEDGGFKKKKWPNDTSTTIGCGYIPQLRRALFTLNGDLVRELDNLEFKFPMRAVVGSNYDVTVLVNFGQCSFEFVSDNKHKMFKSSLRDESGDLFSIHKLDSQWWSGRRTVSVVSQQEAESDLFEISLDARG